jgi:DDE family transposase
MRLVWSAMLMAWSEQKQLGESFIAMTTLCKRMCPHWQLGSSYDGWVQALAREEDRLLPLIFGRLRKAMGTMKQRLPTQRWQALAVDGTTVVCPRTLQNQQAMGERGQPEGMPLASLTVLFDLQLGLPWAFRVGPGSQSERAHLLDMLDELQMLLVADAGFVGYEFCRRLMENGKHFLLRVGGNLRLLKDLGFAHEVEGETVYLWPTDQQKRNEPALQLRLIVLQKPGRRPVYLLTDVLDPELLGDDEASQFYEQRWGEEVFYRTTKQTFEFHCLRSRTPQNCYQELTWAVIGIWLLGLLTLINCRRPAISPGTGRPRRRAT